MAQTNVSKIRPGFLITDEWLEDEDACGQQVGRFRTVYPKGMQINTRNLNIARSKYRLSTRWLIETILTWSEMDVLFMRVGIYQWKNKWTKKDAKLLHPAFIKILGER